jgi:hypothetical protein
LILLIALAIAVACFFLERAMRGGERLPYTIVCTVFVLSFFLTIGCVMGAVDGSLGYHDFNPDADNSYRD